MWICRLITEGAWNARIGQEVQKSSEQCAGHGVSSSKVKMHNERDELIITKRSRRRLSREQKAFAVSFCSLAVKNFR